MGSEVGSEGGGPCDPISRRADREESLQEVDSWAVREWLTRDAQFLGLSGAIRSVAVGRAGTPVTPQSATSPMACRMASTSASGSEGGPTISDHAVTTVSS
jgi:hypothetical protein